MDYPKVLPAGTLIRVNQRKNTIDRIAEEAVGIVFQLQRDSQLHPIYSQYYAKGAKVLVAPKGWHSKTIGHFIDLEYDEIIETVSNKHLKGVLNSIEGEM